MNIEETEFQLKKMRLPRMREEYARQRKDPKYQNISFDERFAEIVSLEFDTRTSNSVEKRSTRRLSMTALQALRM